MSGYNPYEGAGGYGGPPYGSGSGNYMPTRADPGNRNWGFSANQRNQFSYNMSPEEMEEFRERFAGMPEDEFHRRVAAELKQRLMADRAMDAERERLRALRREAFERNGGMGMEEQYGMQGGMQGPPGQGYGMPQGDGQGNPYGGQPPARNEPSYGRQPQAGYGSPQGYGIPQRGMAGPSAGYGQGTPSGPSGYGARPGPQGGMGPGSSYNDMLDLP
jgi:hypothetical protein